MGNFKKGGFQGGRGNRDFQGKKPSRPDFGDRGQKQMFTAVCASCRKPCEVPFRPTGDRPVYCDDCFRNSRGEAPRPPRDNRFAERKFSTGDSIFVERKIDEIKKQVDALHAKLDSFIMMNRLSSTDSNEAAEEAKPPVRKAKSAAKKEVKAAKAAKRKVTTKK